MSKLPQGVAKFRHWWGGRRVGGFFGGGSRGGFLILISIEAVASKNRTIGEGLRLRLRASTPLPLLTLREPAAPREIPLCLLFRRRQEFS